MSLELQETVSTEVVYFSVGTREFSKQTLQTVHGLGVPPMSKENAKRAVTLTQLRTIVTTI